VPRSPLGCHYPFHQESLRHLLHHIQLISHHSIKWPQSRIYQWSPILVDCFLCNGGISQPDNIKSNIHLVSRHFRVTSTGPAVVDDSALGVTLEYKYNQSISLAENAHLEVTHVMGKLYALAQHWEHLLFSTGGDINLQKSHWYIMTWK
jgi:hypothetical protein